ncbi:hypothetical protein DID88_004302 [Monilinia fructigena]|uniref:Uncharacterized protein n=1 Tax=Monilinia fructigena TaxID=38457 RepID=A0A395ITN8_9HELO|nr:hypothetical protein DID88_004302 [Monilinia fructigena]
MELLPPGHRNFLWEGQKEDLDKNIQEKTGELDRIEDAYDEKYTANEMRVVDSGIPGVSLRGLAGSINGVQLNWYGSHKSLLVVDLPLLHACVRRVGKGHAISDGEEPDSGPR